MFSRGKKAAVYDELRDSVALAEPYVEETPAPLPAVMERAKAATSPVICDLDYYEISNELARLNRERQSLFGVEELAARHVASRISTMKQSLIKVKAHQKLEGQTLQKLSPEVLTWRKKDYIESNGCVVPVPELAMFSLDDANFSLRTSGWTDWRCTPDLPQALTLQYQDVFTALNGLDAKSHYRMGHALIATFTGVIPAETKKKISAAKDSKAFSSIHLVAEADWTLDIHPNPYYADPIVVGLVNDEMWVIDVFDPTPLEEYAAREFTS